MCLSAARLFREGPRQHELGLEDGRLGRNHAVEGGAHPLDLRVAQEALDLIQAPAGLLLEPGRSRGSLLFRKVEPLGSLRSQDQAFNKKC